MNSNRLFSLLNKNKYFSRVHNKEIEIVFFEIYKKYCSFSLNGAYQNRTNRRNVPEIDKSKNGENL